MGAETPERRTKTARELAALYGVHPATVRRTMAEPRADYLARAAARRAHAVELRAQGMKHRQIAEEMGCSIGTVGRLLYEARRSAETQAGPSLQQSA